MNKDIFASTIVMLGFKKLGLYQYSKKYSHGRMLILCRDNGALVIDSVNPHGNINEYVDYDTLMKEIYTYEK